MAGFADNVIFSTSSHFCSAEKQFRFPLELGTQRPPSAQWTVTGSGSAVLKSTGNGPYVTHVTTGKIVDMGIKDVNNMGSAMAPAIVILTQIFYIAFGSCNNSSFTLMYSIIRSHSSANLNLIVTSPFS